MMFIGCYFIAANYKLQNESDSKRNMDAETQHRIQQLTKEKDELLDLAMQRGKIVHVCKIMKKKWSNIPNVENVVVFLGGCTRDSLEILSKKHTEKIMKKK